VALLNDCKYGYDIKDNVMRLTLIKSGIDPDPEADQGRHVFTYSLLPHAGGWREGDVTRAAYELNWPAFAGALPHPNPLPLGEGAEGEPSALPVHPRAEGKLPLPPAGEGGRGDEGELQRLPTPSRFSLASLDADHVIIDTVKPAEEGEAVIFRVYEYQQRRSPVVTLTLGRPVARAVECNLMEDGETPVEHNAAGLRFAIAPFEIKTFKVWFQS